MTARMPRPDGRALCTAHSAVALDTVPPDPLESLPLMASERCFCRDIWGAPWDGGGGTQVITPECPIHGNAAHPREDLTAATGTEA